MGSAEPHPPGMDDGRVSVLANPDQDEGQMDQVTGRMGSAEPHPPGEDIERVSFSAEPPTSDLTVAHRRWAGGR